MTDSTKQRVCAQCKEDFTNSNRGKKAIYCSKKCRRDRDRANSAGSYSSFGCGPCNLGASSELIVAADLMRSGFSVFRSLSPSAPFDLFCFKENIQKRIEVKTSARVIKTGKLHVPAISKASKHEVVAVVVYEPFEIVYMPPLDGWK